MRVPVLCEDDLHYTALQDAMKGSTLSVRNTQELQGHKKQVRALAWNCTGDKLATGSIDKTARVWSVGSHSPGRELELRGHDSSVDQLAWHPTNPHQLATVSQDRTVRIWDCKASGAGSRYGGGQGQSVISASKTIKTKDENINITWDPSGNYIIFGSRADVIMIVDVRTSKAVLERKMSSEVNEMAFPRCIAPSSSSAPNRLSAGAGASTFGSCLFMTTGNNQQGIIECFPFDTTTGTMAEQPSRSIVAHTSSVYCVDFSPCGKYFATGSADALSSLWDADELICTRTFDRLDWPVRTVSFSHDSRFLATGSEDHVVDIADVNTGARACSIAGRGATNMLAWHPKQLTLAIAADERDVHSVRLCNFTEAR